MSSDHLQRLITNENGITNMQVVFCDIQSYSQRNSKMQLRIIRELQKSLLANFDAASKAFEGYLQKNNLEALRDSITIPTGDGAAIAFMFGGLHDIHLRFAYNLQQNARTAAKAAKCGVFIWQGWCNCHDIYNLRIGIDEGKGVVYQDLHGHFNIAGSAINTAARVMGTAPPQKIRVTDRAYAQMLSLSEDPRFATYFGGPIEAEVKHKVPLRVFECRTFDQEPLILQSPALLHNPLTAYDVVIVRGELTIAPDAKVCGDIVAEDVIVYGSVQGNITAFKRLELKSGCRVEGDLRTARFVVEEGARHRGKQILSSHVKLGDSPSDLNIAFDNL